MNYYLLVGIIFSILAAVFTGYGSIIQYKLDTNHKEKLEGFVKHQEEKDRPILHVLSAVVDNKQIATLSINNSGEKPAEKTTLAITYHPNKFIESMKIVLPIIPNGSTVSLPFDMWQSGFTKQIGGDLNENKENWQNFLSEFETGTKALIVHFHLEYEYSKEVYKSGNYGFLYTKQGEFFFSPAL